MIGIIVITHGTMAEHVVSSAKMIVGEACGVHAISFKSSDSLETLKNAALEAVKQYADDGCLILTDMMGGSATNICVDLMKSDKVEVVTGVNLPMLLGALSYRDIGALKETAAKVQASGVKSIINLKEYFERRAEKKK